jgi:hypothetical protein
MKWIIHFSLFTSLISSLSLIAQNSNRIGVFMGPQLNFPNPAFPNPAKPYDLGLRFSAGVFHEWAPNPHVAITSEINYSGFGIREKITIDPGGNALPPGSYTNIQNLNYLQIPFGFKLRTDSYWINAWLAPEMYAAILVTARSQISSNDVQFFSNSNNIIESFSPVDLGIRATIGIDFTPIPEHAFTVGFRFIQGLHEINRGSELRNRAISLFAGYTYKWKANK